jgi:hypothetical protein
MTYRFRGICLPARRQALISRIQKTDPHYELLWIKYYFVAFVSEQVLFYPNNSE